MILIEPFIRILLTFLDLYIYVVWAEIILSWLIAFNLLDARQKIVDRVLTTVHSVTEPVLNRIRSVIKPVAGLDFSPMVLLFALYFVQGILWRILI